MSGICEKRVESLKRQLEAHYLKELELMTEILDLDIDDSEKLYVWLKKECKSYAAVGELIKYAEKGGDKKSV